MQNCRVYYCRLTCGHRCREGIASWGYVSAGPDRAMLPDRYWRVAGSTPSQSILLLARHFRSRRHSPSRSSHQDPEERIPSLPCSGSGAVLLEPGYQRARPWQRLVEIVNAEEQQQSVAWRWVGSGKREDAHGLPTDAGRAEPCRPCRRSDRSIRGQERLRQAQQRLIPREAASDIGHSDDGPRSSD